MSYIMDLRKIVGHRPLLQVGASVIVEDEEGRILLQKRRDCRQWGYHGGSVELDESCEDAARRELAEETGLVAGKMELLGVYSGKGMRHVYPNGDEVSNVDVVYVCRDWQGVPCVSDEVEELRFFAGDALPMDLFAPNVLGIMDWKRMRD